MFLQKAHSSGSLRTDDTWGEHVILEPRQLPGSGRKRLDKGPLGLEPPKWVCFSHHVAIGSLIYPTLIKHLPAARLAAGCQDTSVPATEQAPELKVPLARALLTPPHDKRVKCLAHPLASTPSSTASPVHMGLTLNFSSAECLSLFPSSLPSCLSLSLSFSPFLPASYSTNIHKLLASNSPN